MKLTEQQRDRRNLRPHAEARLAMCLWSQEYAFKQRGGSMDFWDTRTPAQQRMCKDIIDEILKVAKENGRAALEGRYAGIKLYPSEARRYARDIAPVLAARAAKEKT